MFIKILPIPTHSALERAAAISAELFAISRPPAVRDVEDVSNYLFGWVAHPTGNEAVLMGVANYQIKVHPQNNLTALMALFPALTEAEKAGLTAYIEGSQSFPFQNILPSTTEILTEQEFLNEYQQDGSTI
jgi:hypothetical protein